ncbi:hypothetical protein AgCh_004931 [Apium graveolens]
MDIKSVFLDGELEKEVYMEQPPDFEDPNMVDFVYFLFKVLYELKQAPKTWYLKGTPNLCIWYLKGIGFDLVGYTDSDFAGCKIDQKRTSRSRQFLEEDWFHGIARSSTQYPHQLLKRIKLQTSSQHLLMNPLSLSCTALTANMQLNINFLRFVQYNSHVANKEDNIGIESTVGNELIRLSEYDLNEHLGLPRDNFVEPPTDAELLTFVQEIHATLENGQISSKFYKSALPKEWNLFFTIILYSLGPKEGGWVLGEGDVVTAAESTSPTSPGQTILDASVDRGLDITVSRQPISDELDKDGDSQNPIASLVTSLRMAPMISPTAQEQDEKISWKLDIATEKMKITQRTTLKMAKIYGQRLDTIERKLESELTHTMIKKDNQTD